jgi:hypothetical protein
MHTNHHTAHTLQGVSSSSRLHHGADSTRTHTVTTAHGTAEPGAHDTSHTKPAGCRMGVCMATTVKHKLNKTAAALWLTMGS